MNSQKLWILAFCVICRDILHLHKTTALTIIWSCITWLLTDINPESQIWHHLASLYCLAGPARVRWALKTLYCYYYYNYYYYYLAVKICCRQCGIFGTFCLAWLRSSFTRHDKDVCKCSVLCMHVVIANSGVRCCCWCFLIIQYLAEVVLCLSLLTDTCIRLYRLNHCCICVADFVIIFLYRYVHPFFFRSM